MLSDVVSTSVTNKWALRGLVETVKHEWLCQETISAPHQILWHTEMMEASISPCPRLHSHGAFQKNIPSATGTASEECGHWRCHHHLQPWIAKNPDSRRRLHSTSLAGKGRRCHPGPPMSNQWSCNKTCIPIPAYRPCITKPKIATHRFRTMINSTAFAAQYQYHLWNHKLRTKRLIFSISLQGQYSIMVEYAVYTWENNLLNHVHAAAQHWH